MVVHNHKKKMTAKRHAVRMRKKGFVCSVIKKKKGYGTTVNRK